MGHRLGFLLMCLMALAGSTLSPNFLSPAFPPTRLTALAPGLFAPQVWSLVYALGSALVVGLVWLSTALVGEDLLRGSTAQVCLDAPRHNRAASSLLSGLAVVLALAGGMTGQGPVPEAGLLSAGALGLLATATSLTRERPLLRHIAALFLAYVLVALLLVHRIGIQPRVFGALGILAGLHLLLASGFLDQPGRLGAAGRARNLALLIFLAVAALVVGAQGLASVQEHQICTGANQSRESSTLRGRRSCTRKEDADDFNSSRPHWPGRSGRGGLAVRVHLVPSGRA